MRENKSAVLNRFFSRNTFRDIIDSTDDEIYKSVILRYVKNPENKKNVELISEIYTELKKNYRNEYYYKNTLLNKLLLGVHSINTTVALTEIPISKSKADFVLINGKAIAYEIKTELDNLDRLENQINDYYKAFDHVSVITCKENLALLENKLEIINKPIGIYVLQNNGSLSIIQKPLKYSDSLDKNIIFKILRKSEYESIIMQVYGELPQVTQFKYYSECLNLFLKVDLDKVYELFIAQLKKRTKVEKELYQNVPYELKFLTYFMDLKEADYSRLNSFLYNQFGGM
ncbi:sce7726 family protein [Anaerocolumna xylanovorans]|uniref:Sce7726 family protein n=1 Tax=Anaerocolumna xylanovorans DSM 12503 TaxID=1121345 RepID=A0A1M7Y8V4_9FIRM|nr:sce7726 family protein [Anaerocolumna xylanovorans]SHO48958.1 hypothetical protein SAMN02745217_02112 [Anaerocolumna xylanovorans DSM 12503]